MRKTTIVIEDTQFIHVCCIHIIALSSIIPSTVYRDSTYNSDGEDDPLLYAPLSMWLNFNIDFFPTKKQSRRTILPLNFNIVI